MTFAGSTVGAGVAGNEAHRLFRLWLDTATAHVTRLERQSGDWFDDLLRRQDSYSSCAVRDLFHPPKPIRLTPLPSGPLRRQILRQTLERAAALNHRPAPERPPEDDEQFNALLASPCFDQPLKRMWPRGPPAARGL